MDYIKRVLDLFFTLVKALDISAFKESPHSHKSTQFNSFNVSLHKTLSSR